VEEEEEEKENEEERERKTLRRELPDAYHSL